MPLLVRVPVSLFRSNVSIREPFEVLRFCEIILRAGDSVKQRYNQMSLNAVVQRYVRDLMSKFWNTGLVARETRSGMLSVVERQTSQYTIRIETNQSR